MQIFRTINTAASQISSLDTRILQETAKLSFSIRYESHSSRCNTAWLFNELQQALPNGTSLRNRWWLLRYPRGLLLDNLTLFKDMKADMWKVTKPTGKELLTTSWITTLKTVIITGDITLPGKVHQAMYRYACNKLPAVEFVTTSVTPRIRSLVPIRLQQQFMPLIHI